MAKKKADKPPKLAAVARRALGELGLEASAGDVRAWIKSNMEGYEYNEGTLSATLAGQRKLLREQQASGAAPAGPAPAPAAPASVPTADELLAVKGIADQRGGVDELLKMVRAISELARGVGGAERLEQCLDYLTRMGVK